VSRCESRGQRVGTSRRTIAVHSAGRNALPCIIAPGSVGTTILRIRTAKLPDTALHSRHRLRGPGGNGDFADETEESGYFSISPAPSAMSRELWERPLGTQESPERPFLFHSGRGESQRRCKAVSGRFPCHPQNRSSHRPRRNDLYIAGPRKSTYGEDPTSLQGIQSRRPHRDSVSSNHADHAYRLQ